MSNSSGRAVPAGAGRGDEPWGELHGNHAVRAAASERDTGEDLLGFLTRLAGFGLAAGGDPLLKPAKPRG